MTPTRSLARWITVPVLSVLVGCGGSTSATPAFQDMAEKVEQRSGHKVPWNQGGAEDRKVDEIARDLLTRELSVDQAVYLSLIGNRTLQAEYEELSLAQADFVQAGLLANPVLSVGVGFSNREHASTPNVGVGVGWDFMSLFTRAARRKIAETQLESAKLRIGSLVLRHVAEVRTAYYSAQSAAQVAAMRSVVLEASQAAVELATRQHEAGNINDLDLVNEQTQAQQMRLDLSRSQADVLASREQLTRLMGLWGAHTQWRIPTRLPDLPPSEPPLEHLESLAVAQRLDIASARKDVESAEQAASLVRQTRFFGSASVGATYEHRVVEKEDTVGPTAGLELPLFDQRQAQIAALEAIARQNERRLGALATDARSEVRVLRGRLVFLRQIAEQYRTSLVPMRERAVALAQQQYNAMLLGVFQLLAAKQAEVNTYREYIEAVRDYWIARAELERAVGGRLEPGAASMAGPGSAPAPEPAPSATPAPPPDHSHHH